MKPYLKNKNYTKKRAIIIVAALIVLAIIGFGTAQVLRNRAADNADTESTDTVPQETIKYEPATGEEKQQTEQHKGNLVKEDSQPPTPAGSKKAVTPIITDASQYDDRIEVRSFIPSIVESGGTCTLTFKQGSAQILKTVEGAADATTTRCEPSMIPRSEFTSSGKWVLTITYTSAASSGTSDPWDVEVK